MNKIWFTSDTHFSHANIIRYCERPFRDVNEMNRTLSQNWNSTVDSDDIIVHMGDVTMMSRPDKDASTLKILKNLKGRKVLVYGNHDKQQMRLQYEEWGWTVVKSITCSGVFLQHYHEKNPDNENDLIIHGHSHNSFHAEGFIDVGVDAQPGFKPVDARSILDDEKYYSLRDVLVELVREKNGCLGNIFGTFVMCGEDSNFCSRKCQQLVQKDDFE